MYLEIKNINKKLFDESLSFFSNDFINELKQKSTFKESLVARYLIEKNKNINPKYINYSISHKKDLVFI
jgi:hypothetical protein